MFLANGEMPETTNDWHWSDGLEAARFANGWHPSNAGWDNEEDEQTGSMTVWDLFTGSGEGEFSTSGCDCCGGTTHMNVYPGHAVARVYSSVERLALAGTPLGNQLEGEAA